MMAAMTAAVVAGLPHHTTRPAGSMSVSPGRYSHCHIGGLGCFQGAFFQRRFMGNKGNGFHDTLGKGMCGGWPVGGPRPVSEDEVPPVLEADHSIQ